MHQIKNIVIPKGVESIEDYEFKDCDLFEIFFESDTLPNNLSTNWNSDNIKFYLASEWKYNDNNVPLPIDKI